MGAGTKASRKGGGELNRLLKKGENEGRAGQGPHSRQGRTAGGRRTRRRHCGTDQGAARPTASPGKVQKPSAIKRKVQGNKKAACFEMPLASRTRSSAARRPPWVHLRRSWNLSKISLISVSVLEKCLRISI